MRILYLTFEFPPGFGGGLSTYLAQVCRAHAGKGHDVWVLALDGGQPAWVRDGHAVTTDLPAPRRGTLAPLTLRPSIVDAKFVFCESAQTNAPA
mgnify:CR=1 FL=1